ncbi:hypothetical protein SESBI_46638 [Sesbania bispinosa]|nr:hypothetical protein SESBI_46638 [Sesbania bispinosa]
MAEITKFTPLTFTHPVSIKLDENNFLIWKHQPLSRIKGYKLQQFITGNRGMPKKFLNDEDEALRKWNEEFVNWEQHDQLLTS